MGYACRNMNANKSDNLQSWYQSREKAALTAMEKLIDQFLSIE